MLLIVRRKSINQQPVGQFAVTGQQGREIPFFGYFIKCYCRFVGLFQQKSSDLAVRQFLGPVGMAIVVFAPQFLQTFLERRDFRQILFLYGLQDNQVGFNNIFRWWENVGDQVFSPDDIPIDRAIDLDPLG